MTQQDRGELARLQEAFSEEGWETAEAEGCPKTDVLWASAAGELDPAADEAVILHLAICPRCAAAWRLAKEMVSGEEATPARVVSMETARSAGGWRRPALWVAAAALVIGVGFGSVLLHRGGVAPAPVYRQQASGIQITASPDTGQRSRTDCRLRWSAGPQGTRYDLTVTGEDLSILTIAKGLSKPEYILPPEKIPASTGEILWRVTAHMPDGRSIASETFTTRIED